jgi:hypothetical protein
MSTEIVRFAAEENVCVPDHSELFAISSVSTTPEPFPGSMKISTREPRSVSPLARMTSSFR